MISINYKFCIRFVLMVIITISQTSFAQTHKTSYFYQDTEPILKVDSLKDWLIKNPKPNLLRLKNLIMYKRCRIATGEFNVDAEEIKKLAESLNSRWGMGCYWLVKNSSGLLSLKLAPESEILAAMVEFEAVNDYNGLFHSNLLLFVNNLKTQVNKQGKFTGAVYIERAEKLLKYNNRDYDKILLLTAKHMNEMVFKNYVKAEAYLSEAMNLRKKNPKLQTLDRLLNGLDLPLINKIKNNDGVSEDIVKYYENESVLDKANQKIMGYKLVQLGDLFVRVKKYDKATYFYKKAISVAQKFEFDDLSSLSYAYSSYRKIVHDINKDYKLSAALADTIMQINERLFVERMKNNQNNFLLKYDLEKQNLEKQLIEKNYYLSLSKSKQLEKNLAFEAQKTRNDSLKNIILLNQKELELSQNKSRREKLEFISQRIQEDNQTLRYILAIVIISGLISLTFYLRLRNVNAKLKSINQSREKLITIIGHDLKSPMNSFQAFSDVANYLIQKKDFQRLSEIGNQMKESSTAILSLINNLIYWGINNQNHTTLVEESIQLEPLAKDIISYFKHTALLKNVNFNIKIDEEAWVIANTFSLSLVLRNLIDNAVKNAPENSDIQLSTRPKNNLIEVIISNDFEGDHTEKQKIMKSIFSKELKPQKQDINEGIGMLLVKEFIHKFNIPFQFLIEHSTITIIIGLKTTPN